MKENKGLFRHELKYIITYPEMEILIKRLELVMKRDKNAKNGEYLVRSLYFDDMNASSENEKLMGITGRTKYRIRCYNAEPSVIKLEKKRKEERYIHKTSVNLTEEEVNKILNGDLQFLLSRKEGLCREFYIESMTKLYKPRVIVDYERIPFVMDEGDVRVTFDKHVRAGFQSFDIFDKDIPSYGVMPEEYLVMEVKFTEFFPEMLRFLLPTDAELYEAASKYLMCVEGKKNILGLN